VTSDDEGSRFGPDRFEVVYRIAGPPDEVETRAKQIALEQTVEMPDEVVTDAGIRQHIIGRVERLTPLPDGASSATISYSVDAAGDDLTQLLNVVFGNSSIQPGLRVEDVRLPGTYLRRYRGPRFGRAGLRDAVGVKDRALLCTALKPMGSSSEELAELAYRFALGGIDIVKDDHGLANQSFAPFEERVERCVDAVERANRETGLHCVYAPNVCAPGSETLRRARFAAGAGAGAALVMPGLVGFGSMLELSLDDTAQLPLLMHPAFLGSFVAQREAGIAHGVLFGTLARLAGADASIFPSYGGRFAFEKSECLAIRDAASTPIAQLRPIFPAPGGGMILDRVPELLDVYGDDIVLLIGGDLYRNGHDLTRNAARFRDLLQARTTSAP